MKTKTIVLSITALIFVVGVLVVGTWVAQQPSKQTCSGLDIQLVDSIEQRFVTVEEMHSVLKSKGLYPVGEAIEAVSCHAIERCMEEHDMIRSAECYKLVNGEVRLRLKQRVPMFLVVGTDGSFYVDTDRKVMPVRATIDVEVPVIKGTVSQRAAVEDYYDFAEWLAESDYWKGRIKFVHVQNAKHIVLIQNEMNAKIILGELTGYKKKLNKLEKLYTKGFDRIGYPEYREYDLRYAGQVVGRK